MKRESYSLSLLLVVTGLFSSLFLSAQQYHDAAAFGLKGNVKECKVVSGDFDPHTFVSLSFSKNGELERWEEDKGLLFTSFECERKNGYLSKLSKSHTGIYDMFISDTHCFFYDANKQLVGSSYFSNYEIGDIAFINEFSISGNTLFHKEATINEFDNTDQVLAAKTATEKALTAGKGIQAIYSSSVPGLKEKMSLEEDSIVIKEVDSHGNYIVLEYENNRITKRIITYWDDEPASVKPASAKPVQAPKPAVTETAPEKAEVAKNVEVTKPVEDFRAATPKELSASDILTRPFGVLPTERWRCSMDQILSDLSRYGWKTKIDNEFSFSYTIELDNILDKSGYDLSVLGVVPFSVTARFREDGKELSSMSYSLSSKNHKEAREFCDRLISYLRSAGVDFPEPSKHASEVSAKYGKSIVRIKFPGKGSTVSFLDIDYWSYYWSSDGQWVSGWVE